MLERHLKEFTKFINTEGDNIHYTTEIDLVPNQSFGIYHGSMFQILSIKDKNGDDAKCNLDINGISIPIKKNLPPFPRICAYYNEFKLISDNYVTVKIKYIKTTSLQQNIDIFLPDYEGHIENHHFHPMNKTS
jgi:hypothetical protein